MDYISSMQTRITAAEEMHFLLVSNYKILNAYIRKNKKIGRKLAIILVSSFKRKANDLPNFQQANKSYEQYNSIISTYIWLQMNHSSFPFNQLIELFGNICES